MNQWLKYVTTIDIENIIDLIFPLIIILLEGVIVINLKLVDALIAFDIHYLEVRIFFTMLLLINLSL